jgi:hypothetical protein
VSSSVFLFLFLFSTASAACAVSVGFAVRAHLFICPTQCKAIVDVIKSVTTSILPGSVVVGCLNFVSCLYFLELNLLSFPLLVLADLLRLVSSRETFNVCFFFSFCFLWCQVDFRSVSSGDIDVLITHRSPDPPVQEKRRHLLQALVAELKNIKLLTGLPFLFRSRFCFCHNV